MLFRRSGRGAPQKTVHNSVRRHRYARIELCIMALWPWSLSIEWDTLHSKNRSHRPQRLKIQTRILTLTPSKEHQALGPTQWQIDLLLFLLVLMFFLFFLFFLFLLLLLFLRERERKFYYKNFCRYCFYCFTVFTVFTLFTVMEESGSSLFCTGLWLTSRQNIHTCYKPA